MEDTKSQAITESETSLRAMVGFVRASSVFKMNLIGYGFVVLVLFPLSILVFKFWGVDNDQDLLPFMTSKLLPATILLALSAALHFIFLAYVTVREYARRMSEFDSYDTFCTAKCREMGQPSWLVGFPVSFWPGFFGGLLFFLFLNPFFTHIFG